MLTLLLLALFSLRLAGSGWKVRCGCDAEAEKVGAEGNEQTLSIEWRMN